MNSQRRIRIIKFFSVCIMSLLGVSLVIMLLWNSLVPAIFNGPVITYFQSLGLLLLVRILTFSYRPWPYRYVQRGGYWQKKFEEKLASMPPDQRERIRNVCASKCSSKWEMRKKTVTATESASLG